MSPGREGGWRLRSGLAAAVLGLAAVLAPIDRAQADIAVGKSIATGYPGIILPGDITAFSISLSNDNETSAVSAVAFNDVMPAAIFVAGAGLVSNTCGGVVTATGGSSTISLAGGTIPVAPGSGTLGGCEIVVEVSSTAQGTSPSNIIAAGTVTGDDGAPVSAPSANQQAEQSFAVLTLTPPTLEKSFAPDTVVADDVPSTLTLIITNPNGSADLPLTTVTDNLPAGMSVAATPNASVTCTGTGAVDGAFTPAASDTVLTLTGGIIGRAGSCVLTVDVVGSLPPGSSTSALVNTLAAADVGNTRGLLPAADASDTLNINSPLRVDKVFNPDPIRAGEDATLLITLSNDSPSTPLTVTTFTDDPIGTPAGLLVTDVPTTTCAGGVVVATGGATGITLAGGTVPAAGNCVITVPYQATLPVPGASSTFSNTIAAGDVGNSLGVTSRPASDTVTVNDELTVAKSVSPTTVAAGNPVTFDVAVRNFTPTAQAAVTFTDTLPGGMVALATPAPGISAGCAGFVADLSTPTAPIFTFDMPAGTGGSPAICTVSFDAQPPPGAAAGTAFANSLAAGAVGNGAVSNPAGSNIATTTIVETVPLSKAFAPDSLSEGGVSQLTITLSNTSANPLTAVAITDNLPSIAGSPPAQVVIASPANATTTCGGAPVITAVPGASVLTMSGASVPARAGGGTGAAGSCVLRVDVVGPAGVYLNTIPAGGMTATETLPGGGTQAINNVSPASATLTYTPALTASKSFSPTVVQPGGTTRVTIRLGNIGSGTLSAVAVTDPLPADTVVASPANVVTTCAGAPVTGAPPGAASVTLSGVVLPAGGSCDYLFDVVASGVSDSVNTIPIGNVTATGGVRNTAPVTATLTKAVGAVVVTKSFSPNSLTAPGQSSTLTVTLLNTGGVPLDEIAITDFFTSTGVDGAPANGMRIAEAPNTATTCVGGVVSATPGDTSASLAGASLPVSGAPGDSCEFSVDVTLTTVGTVLNTLPPSAVSTTQGVTNIGSAQSSLAALARLGVQKSFIPASVAPGVRSRMRLRFLNPLALPITGLSSTDNLPAGLVVPPGPGITSTCTGATVSLPTSSQVVISGGSLPAASGGVVTSCEIELDVVAAVEGAYSNLIAAGSVTADAGGTPVSNPPPDTVATLQVRNPATIAKAFAPISVLPGVPSTLTITLGNPNAVPLTVATFTDTLPAGLTVATTPNAVTTCGGALANVSAPASATRITLSGATIPATGSCTVSVDTLSNTPGVYDNVIASGALTTAEGVTNTDSATSTLAVAEPPTIAKQFSPVAIPAGGVSTLTLALGNTNDFALTLTAVLDDNLPTAPGAMLVATPNGLAGSCTLGSVSAVPGSALVRYAAGATIPAGGCTISVDVTAATDGSYANTIADNALRTDAGNNLLPAQATLDVSPLGFVTGRVYNDNDVVPDGVFTPGTDTPIAGVGITLTGTDYGADGLPGGGDDVAVSLSTTTDALGNYAFTGLNAGNYTVTQPTQPGGTLDGITSAGAVTGGGGGSAGTPSVTGTTPSSVSNIELLRTGGGQVAGTAGNDFAEVPTSSISGDVFLDQNNDGVRNGTDSALAGVTIELLDAALAVVATTVTDADGAWSFDGLAPGTYSVREPAQPADTANGITTAGAVANGGTAGTATPTTVTPSAINGIVLPPGTVAAGNGFAELPEGRLLTGSVFVDYDGNGVQDGVDAGIGGQTITLTGTDVSGNPVTATTTTAADGSWSFTGLPEGTYSVTQPAQPTGTTDGTTTAGSTGGVVSVPPGTSGQISNIDLTGANTVSADNLFAELAGAAADITIAKSHFPTSFAASSGSLSRYTITVSNIGTVPTSGLVTVTDTLPAGLTIASAASGAGWTCSGAVGTSTMTCTTSTAIAAGDSAPDITLDVSVSAGATGSVLNNTVGVNGGGEPAGFDGNNSATDLVAVSAGGSVSGRIWFNSVMSDDTQQPGEPGVEGWVVEARRGGVVVATTISDASGDYTFNNLAPSGGPGDLYELVFRSPTGAVFGRPQSSEPGVDLSGGTIAELSVPSGASIVNQDLPIDPSGVVYDAVSRAPVAGANVTITGPPGFDPAVHLVGGAGNVTQTTDATGFYQYLLLPGAPAGDYTLAVTPPGGYLNAPSTLLPPTPGPLAVGAAPNPLEVSASPAPPPVGTPAVYYFSFTLGPGSADVINNHIPLDPVLSGALTITKSTPLVNVSRGDLVPYTITVTNTLGAALANIDLRDRLPPGFKYRAGSANLDGVTVEPSLSGRDLTWTDLSFAAGQTRTLRLILVVGSGVGEGEYVNTAFALNNLANTRTSNIATATVRVVPDPTFDCSDLIGKVFDDRDADGYQDEGEPGIPAVRMATARGLLVTADDEGRFHVACAAVPQADRGSNFIMKLDPRTLPTGYRLTTENPRVVRLTRGKMTRLDFGAALYRVVRIEVADDAFETGRSALLAVWAQRLESLLDQIEDRPSVVRLAYLRSGESADLARARLQDLADDIRERWARRDCCYRLPVEVEGGDP